MNQHEFEQFLKEVEKCDFCGRPKDECICSDRKTILDKIRKSANGL